MKALVTGSAGHLGEALVRTLSAAGHTVHGLDVLPSAHTHTVGSITDSSLVRKLVADTDVVFHAATLHKPHVDTHAMQAFIDTNVSGTLSLLEASVDAGIESFVFTSTTSAFGHALRPPPGSPAAWVNEDLAPVPRNVYGVTKTAAEGVCEILHRRHGLSCVVLRTSRFFPEEDDDPAVRDGYADGNVKANEFLFRRVELEDVVGAHLLAAQRAPSLGFARFVISATTPFLPEDAGALNTDAPAVLRTRVPEYEAVYAARGWRMFPRIDRVYDNSAARRVLGWEPRYDFHHVLELLVQDQDPISSLAAAVGSKGYHGPTASGASYPFNS